MPGVGRRFRGSVASLTADVKEVGGAPPEMAFCVAALVCWHVAPGHRDRRRSLIRRPRPSHVDDPLHGGIVVAIWSKFHFIVDHGRFRIDAEGGGGAANSTVADGASRARLVRVRPGAGARRGQAASTRRGTRAPARRTRPSGAASSRRRERRQRRSVSRPQHADDRGELLVGRRTAYDAERRLLVHRTPTHNGMLPCFFGGRLSRLFRSSRRPRTICERVSAGRITEST